MCENLYEMDFKNTYSSIDMQCDSPSHLQNKAGSLSPIASRPKQGQAPILLAVPTPGVPRRRHSWICG